MEKPIRILQHVRVLDSGGIESFIFANLRNINRENIVFDFLVTRDVEEFYEDEVKALNGKKIVLEFKRFKNSFLDSLSRAVSFYKFCLENKNVYKVIHFQSIGANGFFDIIAASFAGIPYRIAHSHIAMDIKPAHNSKRENISYIRKRFVLARQEIIKFLVSKNATHYFGCSKMACEWMYSKKINKEKKCEVVNNPIDTKKFVFNENERKRLRKELGIENKFVIGHVGRFVYSKNHEFLIEIFSKIKQKNDDAVLVLVGNGPLKKKINDKISELNLDNDVIFYGETNEIFKLYNIFDLFVFPSYYEGLGIVLIEAQSNGVPIIASDTIPFEVKNVDNFKFMSLKDGVNDWAEEIVSFKLQRNNDNYKRIIKNGYDINDVSKFLEKKYLELNN